MLCLAEPEWDERAAAESMGVRWMYVPLLGTSAAATFDDLERAAGILADPANRPVFFHCKRGVYRSNMGQAVYRMRSCGWDVRQALDELRTTGYAPELSGGDKSCAEFMARYYRERIVARASG